MSRRSIVAIIGTVLVSSMVIFILYAISDRSIAYSQDFSRVFPQEVVIEIGILDVNDDTHYVAGMANDEIYLGSRKNFSQLLVANTLNSHTKHIQLSMGNIGRLRFEEPYVRIDSPFFYIMDGKMPGLFRGNLETFSIDDVINVPYFIDAVPINYHSFAIQTLIDIGESNLGKNVLGKVTKDSADPIININILEAQIDSYYSTKGILRYNKAIKKLVYTYFYRNQYLVMDTSLSLLYKGNTIDTVNFAQIRPISINENTYTLASTSAIVNRDAQVFDKWLYIHSNLMAQNERRDVFDQASVIDVYDITTGKYKLSFYIPDYRSIKLKKFKVFDDKLIALMGRYIVIYSINIGAFMEQP